MDAQVYDILLLPLIIGTTELAKQLGLPRKFAGLFSVGLGIVMTAVYLAPVYAHDPKLIVLKGLAMGLAAVGLYSTTKNSLESETHPNKDEKETID